MKVRLFVPFHKENNILRNIEYDYVLKTNIKNSLIDEIVLVLENDIDEGEINFYNFIPKIKIKKINQRCTYRKLFELVNSLTDNDDINIISNRDIIITEFIGLAKMALDEKKFFTLVRWEINPINGKLTLFDVPYSSDTWIFKGKFKNLDKIDGNYYLGKIACDNRINYEIEYKAGYNLLNPAKDIITIHIHFSNYRTYKHDERVGGEHLWISPTKINEIPIKKIVKTPYDYEKNTRPEKV